MTPSEIETALAAPFEASEIHWKPQAVSGNRALAIAFIDARLVMDRLDEVVGLGCWADRYEVYPDGSVKCSLSLKIDNEWITKEDIGGESEQPDEGDRRKAAFSDALKRAAVKWNVGRYIYRLKPQWVDYDPQKKQFVRPPQLPQSALPAQQTPRPAPAKQEPQPSRVESPKTETLVQRVEKAEGWCVEQKRCEPGELFKALGEKFGKEWGWKVHEWPESRTEETMAFCRQFAADRMPITPDEIEAIGQEMTRTGEKWDRVLKALGLKGKVAPKSLNHGQAKTAIAKLKEMPDAAAA